MTLFNYCNVASHNKITTIGHNFSLESVLPLLHDYHFPPHPNWAFHLMYKSRSVSETLALMTSNAASKSLNNTLRICTCSGQNQRIGLAIVIIVLTSAAEMCCMLEAASLTGPYAASLHKFVMSAPEYPDIKTSNIT